MLICINYKNSRRSKKNLLLTEAFFSKNLSQRAVLSMCSRYYLMCCVWYWDYPTKIFSYLKKKKKIRSWKILQHRKFFMENIAKEEKNRVFFGLDFWNCKIFKSFFKYSKIKFVKLIYLISRIFFGLDFFKFSGLLWHFKNPGFGYPIHH